MKANPVYRKEVKASSRSIRVPMALLGFNGILVAAALINMYSLLYQVRTTAEVQYYGLLAMYRIVAAVEFALLLCVMPAISSGSISGEKEHRTLDLLLTTQMSPRQIVWGKLLSSLGDMFLILISSFPVIALVFVYGGVTPQDVITVILCFVTTALLITGIGLYCSAMFQRTVLSTAVSYASVVLLIGGTVAANRFALGLSTMRWNSYMNQIGSVADQATSGGFQYLLLFNPAVTFYSIIREQSGARDVLGEIARWIGIHNEGWITDHWVLVSIAVQLLTAVLLIRGTARWIDPASRKRRLAAPPFWKNGKKS